MVDAVAACPRGSTNTRGLRVGTHLRLGSQAPTHTFNFLNTSASTAAMFHASSWPRWWVPSSLRLRSAIACGKPTSLGRARETAKSVFTFSSI